MRKYENIVGQVYGYLTITKVDYIKQTNGKWKIYAEHTCRCGKSGRSRLDAIIEGSTKSCGCYSAEVTSRMSKALPREVRIKCRKDPKEVLFNDVEVSYKIGARKRDLEYSISREELIRLVTSNCTYCGSEPTPSQRFVIKYKKICKRQGGQVDEEFAKTKQHSLNGVDRIDPEKGYITDNCVPCCLMCNRAKRDYTLEQWLNWIDKLKNNSDIRLALANYTTAVSGTDICLEDRATSTVV